MLRSGKHYSKEAKEVVGPSQPENRPFNRTSKVLDVQYLDKCTKKLLRSLGKSYPRHLPKRVLPPLNIKLPDIEQIQSPQVHQRLQISSAKDWESDTDLSDNLIYL